MACIRRRTEQRVSIRVAKGAQSSGTAVADLNAIFGKGAAFEMKGALDVLANEGMQNLIEKAKSVGQVLDDEIISKLGQANDDLERTSRQAGNFMVVALANVANGIKNVSAFFGAAAGVGVFEAGKQYTNGEIGVPRERSDAGNAKTKEERRREAEKQARVDALNSRKAAEAALMQAKIEKIMNAPMGSISVGAPVAGDQYARMGLFSGGQVQNGSRMVAERQLRVTEEMNKRLEKVEQLMQSVKENTGATVEGLEE